MTARSVDSSLFWISSFITFAVIVFFTDSFWLFTGSMTKSVAVCVFSSIRVVSGRRIFFYMVW